MILKQTWLRGLPFRVLVLEGYLNRELVRSASVAVPQPSWDGWVSYESSFEHGKLASHPDAHLPVPLYKLQRELESKPFVSFVENQFGLEQLVNDPLRHGSGVHSVGRDGYLSVHLDYALHPKIPTLERRVNVVLFLNEVWEVGWGGALEFFDDLGQRPVISILPAFGRLVLWEATDLSYHGHPEPLRCPALVRRNTLASYLLAPARPSAVRKRALFVPDRKPQSR